jgi:hypothetical protein
MRVAVADPLRHSIDLRAVGCLRIIGPEARSVRSLRSAEIREFVGCCYGMFRRCRYRMTSAPMWDSAGMKAADAQFAVTMAGGIFPSGHTMMPCLPGFAFVACLNTTRPAAIASPRVGMGVHYRGYVVNIPLIGNNHACLTASLTAFSRPCESTGRRSHHGRLQDQREKRV